MQNGVLLKLDTGSQPPSLVPYWLRIGHCAPKASITVKRDRLGVRI